MKRRIIYVGTLMDLVRIMEPDAERESMNNLSDEYNGTEQ